MLLKSLDVLREKKSISLVLDCFWWRSRSSLYLYQSMEHLDFMAEAYAKSLSRFISSNWSSTQGKRFFWWSCNFFVFNGAIWSVVSSNLFLRNSRFCSMFVRSFSESKFSWFICSIIIFTFSSFKLRVIFDNCVNG